MSQSLLLFFVLVQAIIFKLLKSVKIGYNKARQESITKELSEIVGGAMALEG
jgi:hypothetical protein